MRCAKALMVQGTMSGVGKSLLVAGLARVLAQDGLRVAPFKSQNMALNSAVTREGLEMGRAQVVQAEAAGIEPTAAMNPVLLKPTSDVGSQVILRGRPLGTMQAREYFRFRHKLVEPIREAYQELASAYDVVLIEGAGSPAELNLKRDDIVNMGMAKIAQSPVLLVGDIDRGGVFAQLIGTLDLLEPDERRMVRGSVVNKFRGDATLFDDGRAILAQRMGVPVVGMVGYLDVDIDDEDSLSSRLEARQATGTVDVAVIRLPKISNFTDFIALQAIEGVSVRYVTRAAELGQPSAIVVPGTKSTMADLRWMRERGLEAAVVAAARAGTCVWGICGGYQMLGTSISDPEGAEDGGAMAGMGLLPVRTVFSANKKTVQARATFGQVEGCLQALSGKGATGYEIHMGRTTREGGRALLRMDEGAGGLRDAGCQQGNVYGCYLHGVFDEADVAQAFVRSLAPKDHGLGLSARDMAAYKQEQYDRLADGVRAGMDMDAVYRIIEEGL